MAGEIKIGEDVYRYGKMDGLTQIEIVARLASVGQALKDVLPKGLALAREAREEAIAAEARKADGVELTPDEQASQTAAKIERIWDVAGPLANAIARLTPDDKRYIIAEAMRIVERQEPGDKGWFRVWNDKADRFQYREMQDDGALILVLTCKVLAGVLGGFFNIAPLVGDRR